LPLSYLHRDEQAYLYTTIVVDCPFDIFSKLARLDQDIKGTINYVGGVTVSLLVSMKISKGQSTTLVV
jgi:hypothetical protein